MIGLHNSDVRKIKLKSVSVQVIVPQVAKTKTQRKVSKSLIKIKVPFKRWLAG